MKLRNAAIALMIAIIGFGVAATPASAKPTQLHHGSGFAVKPATFSGWVADGEGSDLPSVGGRTRRPDLNFGSIKWNFWNEKKAVGIAAGWSTSCQSQCESEFPFNGTPLRITAYRPKGGHFTLVKIRSAATEKYYLMKLKYIGPQDNATAWKVLKVNDHSRD
jgi:hypothetical protein